MSVTYTGNRRVRFLQAGRGDVLLLLHGEGGRAERWNSFLAPFHRRYRVIAPDLPGHGGSDPLPTAGAWRTLESFPGEFLDALEVDRASVIAQGIAGLAALSWALREPARIRDLVLIAPAGLTPLRGPARRLRGGGTTLRARLLTSPVGAPRLLGQLVAAPSTISPEDAEEVLEGYRQQSDLSSLFREIPAASGLPLVPHLVPRTLVLWGSRDRVADPRLLRDWVSRIPRAAGMLLPDVAHLPMVEDPRQLGTVVVSFFSGFEPSLPSAEGAAAR